MSMDTFFKIITTAFDIEDTVTGKKKQRQDELNSRPPRQRWIQEQMDFQRRTGTGRYTFIPTNDGDYDIIDNGM